MGKKRGGHKEGKGKKWGGGGGRRRKAISLKGGKGKRGGINAIGMERVRTRMRLGEKEEVGDGDGKKKEKGRKRDEMGRGGKKG
jgi:hypothetical protein